MADPAQRAPRPASATRSRSAGRVGSAGVVVIAILGALISSIAYSGGAHFDPALRQLQSWKTHIPSFSKQQPVRPDDYHTRAKQILQSTPLIDGHNDFPFLLRQQLHGKIYERDFENETLGTHTDIQKLKAGRMGGQFWSVYVPCPEDLDPAVDPKSPKKRMPGLNAPNWAVRDTLEQIDLTKRLITHYPTVLEFCTSPSCVRRAHSRGRIASMIGIEGGHQTGNSVAALRQFYELGVRYMTLTHNCDNAFATSCVGMDLDRGIDDGLSDFGKDLVGEMNRLGMMVDLAHVSFNTMREVLHVARAPVIFSHSGVYSLNKHRRNVPDDVLRTLKVNGGIVMVPAISIFMNTDHPEQATVEDVIDHILWVAKLAGWEHVGLGSDFDGSTYIVKGLEDTSQWPNLIERLLARNVSDEQAKLLAGENLLRVWTEVKQSARQIQERGELPNENSWIGRLWEPQNFDVPQLLPA